MDAVVKEIIAESKLLKKFPLRFFLKENEIFLIVNNALEILIGFVMK
jgi:hypothetical protein